MVKVVLPPLHSITILPNKSNYEHKLVPKINCLNNMSALSGVHEYERLLVYICVVAAGAEREGERGPT